MGAWTSRRNQGVEEVDIPTNNAYRYPPKSGCYFGSHFIMGGDRFETTQPEAYLFGDNQDLNFLGSRPVPFPYPAPQAHEPTKTLKSLINIRKDSLRFIKVGDDDASSSGSGDRRISVPDPSEVPLPESPLAERAVSKEPLRRLSEVSANQETQSAPPSPSPAAPPSPSPVVPPSPSPNSAPAPAPDVTEPTKYNLEFTFDSDVKCAITIMYFATEEISNKQAIYRPRDAAMNSETFRFKRGANQVFCQTSHIIEPGKFSEEEWQYNPDKEIIPVVIQCVVEEEEYVGHSHMTFATVEKVDHGYAIKPLKQKQMVDGLCYLLQEIYGIENKNNDTPKVDDEFEENGSECVICLVEMRDTLILPCRHLCLCNCCADNLRYQASNCPICRSPFRALLQIRAMRKKMIPITSQTASPDPAGDSPSQEGIPPGYEAVALIDALNGPSTPSTNPNRGSRRNFPDARGRTGSQPTSPEESPLVGRRRLRRKVSTGSTRSRQSIRSVTLDATRDTSEPLSTERGQQNTPEVIMSDITDVSKSPKPKKFNMPKIKYPTTKSALDEPYYEVVTESAEHELTTGVYEDIKVAIVDETAPEDTEQLSHLIEGTTVVEKTEDALGRVPTPPADYDVLERYPKDASDAGVYFKPGAHKMVLCDPEPIDDPQQPSDSESQRDGLASNTVDPLFQTANPEGPDASGSSYSSTDSTKGLLYQQDMDKGNQDLDQDHPPLV